MPCGNAQNKALGKSVRTGMTIPSVTLRVYVRFALAAIRCPIARSPRRMFAWG